jgi:hypothetical protein
MANMNLKASYLKVYVLIVIIEDSHFKAIWRIRRNDRTILIIISLIRIRRISIADVIRRIAIGVSRVIRISVIGRSSIVGIISWPFIMCAIVNVSIPTAISISTIMTTMPISTTASISPSLGLMSRS